MKYTGASIDVTMNDKVRSQVIDRIVDQNKSTVDWNLSGHRLSGIDRWHDNAIQYNVDETKKVTDKQITIVDLIND